MINSIVVTLNKAYDLTGFTPYERKDVILVIGGLVAQGLFQLMPKSLGEVLVSTAYVRSIDFKYREYFWNLRSLITFLFNEHNCNILLQHLWHQRVLNQNSPFFRLNSLSLKMGGLFMACYPRYHAKSVELQNLNKSINRFNLSMNVITQTIHALAIGQFAYRLLQKTKYAQLSQVAVTAGVIFFSALNIHSEWKDSLFPSANQNASYDKNGSLNKGKKT